MSGTVKNVDPDLLDRFKKSSESDKHQKFCYVLGQPGSDPIKLAAQILEYGPYLISWKESNPTSSTFQAVKESFLVKV